MYEANLGGAKSQRLRKVLLTAKTLAKEISDEKTHQKENKYNHCIEYYLEIS